MSSFHGILAGCLIVYDMGNELIATTSDGHCNCDLSRLSPKIYDFSLRSLMKRYVEELTRKDREKWQLSEIDKAMVRGAEKACEMIEDKAEGHLIRLTSRMEWFPVVYHLVDNVALVVFTVLGY